MVFEIFYLVVKIGKKKLRTGALSRRKFLKSKKRPKFSPKKAKILLRKLYNFFFVFKIVFGTQIS